MPDFKFFGPGIDAHGPYAVEEPIDPPADADDDDSELDFDGDLPSVVDPSKEPTDVVPATDDPEGGEG